MILPSDETELSTKDRPEENSLSTKESFTGTIGVTIGDLDKYKKDSLINIWKDANAYYSSGEEWTDEDAEFFDELAVRINTATEEGMASVSGPAVGMVANNHEDEEAKEEFKEEDHPRDQGGQFTSGGGSQTEKPKSKSQKVKTTKLDKIKDKLLSKLDSGSDYYIKVNNLDGYPQNSNQLRNVPVGIKGTILKSQLQDSYDGAKFSVRKDGYNSMNVSWTGGEGGYPYGSQSIADLYSDSGSTNTMVDYFDYDNYVGQVNDGRKDRHPRDPWTVAEDRESRFGNWIYSKMNDDWSEWATKLRTGNIDLGVSKRIAGWMLDENDNSTGLDGIKFSDFDDLKKEFLEEEKRTGGGTQAKDLPKSNSPSSYKQQYMGEDPDKPHEIPYDPNTGDELPVSSFNPNDTKYRKPKETDKPSDISKAYGDMMSKKNNPDKPMYEDGESLEQILLNENYIQDQFGVFYRPVYVGENYKEHESDLVFEGKLYTNEGVGNCPFCKGAGKITVEKLGLKDCPDCDGTGDIQGEQEMPPQMEEPVEEEKKPNPFAKGGESKVKAVEKTVLEVAKYYEGEQSFEEQFQAWIDPSNYSSSDSYKDATGGYMIDDEHSRIEFARWQLGYDESSDWYMGYEEDRKLDSKYSTESCGCKTKGLEASISKYEKFVKSEINVLKTRAKAGEAVGLMYGLPTVRKNGKKIKGTLAYAGVSLNDRIYLPEELAKGHGKTLPLLLNHSSTAGAEEEMDRLDGEMRDHLENEKDYEVGEVTLTWDADKLTLFYEGVIENEFFQKEVDDMDMAVSLGIFYDSNSPKVCDEECYTLIKGAEFREVSLVYHAGFPIATIEAVESKLKRASIKDIKAKASEKYRIYFKNLTTGEEEDYGTAKNLKDMIVKRDMANDLRANMVDPVEVMVEGDESKANEDSLVKIEDNEDADTQVTVLDEWKNETDPDVDGETKGIRTTKEAIAEEEDEMPLGGSIDAEPKETDVVEQPMIVESVRSQSDFSVRGVSGMTISNSNGVEKYSFDPTQNYETNTVHFSVTEQGGTIFGEEIQMQPKMTTPEELTKEIESKPNVVFTDADEDILKKN
jgi:hypothetical protein